MSHPALTVPQIAKNLSVSEDTVRKWISSGELPGFKLPGSKRQPIYRVARSDYERFLDSRRTVPRRTLRMA